MTNELRFDGRVVVVTGAGAGLGKAYATLFASRGASVVVNDLGSGRHGDGTDFRVADAVVNEIRRNGGTAVANCDSVTDGENIIKTAIDAYGRVDIVINNAGILRDRSFARMSDSDWDIIHDVHVKGALKTTKAAWPYFRKQNYGRIIVTSSNSGLYGNFGQANYSAAKAALVGFAKTLAIEGQKHNIHANVIVPTAGSRLTEDIVPPDFFKHLKPELIAPVVLWLCHENCTENGTIIESALGWAAKCQMVRSIGCNLRKDVNAIVTPESVKENWEKVVDMSSIKRCESIQEATGELLNVLENMQNGSTPEIPKNIFQHTYNYRDAILYAIGVGAKKEEITDFHYLYENDENFSVFPTFYVVFGPIGCMATPILENVRAGTSLDVTMALHGEQYLKVHAPLPKEATVETHFKIQDVLDKGANAVILIEHETFDKNSGEKLTSGQMVLVFKGAGGFKGARNSSYEIPIANKPKRKADAVCAEKTNSNQAVVYRLSGDVNPLHIDPNVALMSGFQEPILHGLCSLGFATRHVLKTYANGRADLFDAVKVRFAKPVNPGETLRTEMWRDGSRIYFETTAVERNVPVITGAYIDLKNVVTQSTEPNQCFLKDNLQSDVIFSHMQKFVRDYPNLAKKVGGLFVFIVTVMGENIREWTFDLSRGEIYEGRPQNIAPESVFRVEDRELIKLINGQIFPEKSLQMEKMNFGNDLMLLQNLKFLSRSCASKL